MLSYRPDFVALKTACYQFYQLLNILATRLVTLLKRVMPSVLLISALLVNSGLHPPRGRLKTPDIHWKKGTFLTASFVQILHQTGTYNLPD